MTASDEVAGLPGGEALAALAAQLRGKPGAIREIANRWSEAAGDCGVHAGTVQTAVADVTQEWQGVSATAFAALMSRFGAACRRAEHALKAAAQTLRAVAGTLEDAHVSVESICENLLGEVSRLHAANPNATSSQLSGQISGLTAEAAAAGRPKVAVAQQALGRALEALNGDLNRLSRTFSALPPPGAPGFLQGSATAGGGSSVPGQSKGNRPGTGSGRQRSSAGHGAKVTSASGASPVASGSGGAAGSPVSSGSGGAAGSPVSSGSGAAAASSGGSADTASAVAMGVPALADGPAAPMQVNGWIGQAVKVLAAQGIPAAKLSPRDIWIIIQHESGGDPTAVNDWDCVTLDCLVLTERNWLKHDEVRVGDQTMGYNFRTGRSEWTPITRVVRHEDAPLVRIGNSRWHATVTASHRWVTMPRLKRQYETCPECGWVPGSATNKGNGVAVHRRKIHKIVPAKSAHLRATEPRFVSTDGIRGRDRLVLAAPAETTPGLEITVNEAAILGWIAGDGYLGVREHRPAISVPQSKPAMVERLKVLLKNVPHARCVDDTGGRGPRHVFQLQHEYARDLVVRTGHRGNDVVSIVLAMSTAQRAAWLDGVVDAERTRDTQPGHARPRVVISQTEGPLREAIKLAVYLSGGPASGASGGAASGASGARASGGPLRGKDQWSPCFQVGIGIPIVTGSSLVRADAGRGPVWCLSTVLGSWTAEQDGHIFLTGNSNAAAGTPSAGLMQTIAPTFDAYALPGHGDIYDPVDNIIAGVRYALARYGSLDNVPGVAAVRSGQPYVGY